MIPDLDKELAIVREWKREDQDVEMNIDDLDYLVKNGFQKCEGDCISRRYCGEDACECIRTIFPSSEHYYMYLEMRGWYLDRLAEKVVMATIGEDE